MEACPVQGRDRNEESTMASGVATTRLKELHFINWLN